MNIEVKRAATKAQTSEYVEAKLELLDAVLVELDVVLAQKQCLSLKDLAVNGTVLLELGVPKGALIGQLLNDLLAVVLNERLENDKDTLLAYITKVHVAVIAEADDNGGMSGR